MSEYNTDKATVQCPHCTATNIISALNHEGVCHDCRSEFTVNLDNPDIICLVGELHFRNIREQEYERLTMAGNVVISTDLPGPTNVPELDSGEQLTVTALNERKLDLADRVHVLNVDGKITDRTQSQIDYATEHNKPIHNVQTTK